MSLTNGLVSAPQLNSVIGDLTSKADERFDQSITGTAAEIQALIDDDAIPDGTVVYITDDGSDGLGGVTIAAGYSDEETYSVGDWVIHLGKLYVCNTAVSTAESFDDTKWTESTVAEMYATLKAQVELKANGHTVVQKTISANGWNSSTGVYSFETDYPNATYDIDDILPNENTTDAQREAWIAADCGGYRSTNTIKAHGDIPEIDIIVSLIVRAK